jgi:hypothetical protein
MEEKANTENVPLQHPYPTEDEKRQIASETNLTLLQVNNWFINARRRILQPMLDGAGAGATEAALQQHRATGGPGTNNNKQQQQQQQQLQQQRSKGRGTAPPPGTGKQLQQQPDWQSEDSGSESNVSSDAEGTYSG